MHRNKERDERSLSYRIGKEGTMSYRPNLDPTEVHDCFVSDFNGTRLSANRIALHPHNRSVRQESITVPVLEAGNQEQRGKVTCPNTFSTYDFQYCVSSTRPSSCFVPLQLDGCQAPQVTGISNMFFTLESCLLNTVKTITLPALQHFSHCGTFLEC